jgi:glycosyltransferase involved in cell wall biosynthesis
MPYSDNASDVVLLTSSVEGSPNVIKEAMGCNCVIVSTDVGDVVERFGGANCGFICELTKEDIKNKLVLALNFKKEANSREYIQNLDSGVVSSKLKALYENVVSN